MELVIIYRRLFARRKLSCLELESNIFIITKDKKKDPSQKKNKKTTAWNTVDKLIFRIARWEKTN